MLPKNKRRTIIWSGVFLGLISGFLYWKFIGCTSGTCALTSHWYNSTIFGGLFGYFISDSFAPKKNAEQAEKTDLQDQ
jgi:hypothetical protein